MPFLVVLIFWLAIIFASFSLFADNNATTVVALGIFALSASAAIFLILELGPAFHGPHEYFQRATTQRTCACQPLRESRIRRSCSQENRQQEITRLQMPGGRGAHCSRC